MRHAVGLVVEAVRHHVVELVEDRVLEDLRVQRGDAVDRVREDDREVGHADLAVPEDRGVLENVGPVALVGREVVGQALAIAAVDLLDEHVEARQEVAEGVNRPLLQGLGHDRVVGEGDGLLGDLVGEVEVNALLVHEQAHELGAAHGGVRVVGVDAHVLTEVFPVGTELALVGAQDGLQARGDEEVLLLEAQHAAVLAGVVGIENRGDGLDVGAELVGAGVVAGVEGVEVEVLGVGLGRPQAQLVHDLAAKADDGHVIGDGADDLAALLGEPEVAVLLVAHDLAAKAHQHRAAVLAGLPGESVGEPVVGTLDLTAALDVLAEEAVAVAHAVAVAGDALVGHGVEEARGQAAQAAVAQARVDLLAANLLEVGAHGLDALGHEVADAEVDQIVVEQRADEELEGEVVDLLLVLGVGARLDGARLARDELGQDVELLLAAALLELGAVLRHAGLAILLDEVLLVLKDLLGSQNISSDRATRTWGHAAGTPRGGRRRLPAPSGMGPPGWAAPLSLLLRLLLRSLLTRS